ncbi:hypothetical protein GGG16DRAFT_89880 [Schizophyllum commune]
MTAAGQRIDACDERNRGWVPGRRRQWFGGLNGQKARAGHKNRKKKCTRRRKGSPGEYLCAMRTVSFCPCYKTEWMIYHAQGGAQVISVTVFRRVRVVDGTKDAARSAGCTLTPGELRVVLLVNVLRRVSRSVSVTAPFLAGVSGGPASALSLDVLNASRSTGELVTVCVVSAVVALGVERAGNGFVGARTVLIDVTDALRGSPLDGRIRSRSTLC